MIGDHEKINITIAQYDQLLSDRKDLARAKNLVKRLRAELQVMRDERKKFVSVVKDTKHNISVAQNNKARWTVALILTKLEHARLI